ncbi:RNA polymerase sigma factor [Bacillus sp. 1P10SD]|uniref:RNA polymerase sigma factor n=1 Tax=Bacillus sp. 1P10SD TaxID=3132265 RepID=UPI0039A5C71B
MVENNINRVAPSCPLSEKDFDQLIKEYEIELRFVAYKYVRNWIIVDDIMQEVFIKIFLKWDSFEQRSSIKSWLYTVTINQCIDYFRSKTVKHTLLIDDLEKMEVLHTDPAAETEAIQQLDNKWLYHTVNSLPTQFKEPIILYYFKQYSYKEIGELLNETICVIKNRLFRGRRLLKELIFRQEMG